MKELLDSIIRSKIIITVCGIRINGEIKKRNNNSVIRLDSDIEKFLPMSKQTSYFNFVIHIFDNFIYGLGFFDEREQNIFVITEYHLESR